MSEVYSLFNSRLENSSLNLRQGDKPSWRPEPQDRHAQLWWKWPTYKASNKSYLYGARVAFHSHTLIWHSFCIFSCTSPKTFGLRGWVIFPTGSEKEGVSQLLVFMSQSSVEFISWLRIRPHKLFFCCCFLSKMSTLEQEGEEVVGQARCPFESRQSNVGLFAGESIKSNAARALLIVFNK